IPSTSEGEVFKLSMLILRLEKILEIRPIIPIAFSVYSVMVNSCFSIFILILSLILKCLALPLGIRCFLYQPLLPINNLHRDPTLFSMLTLSLYGLKSWFRLNSMTSLKLQNQDL